MVCRFCVALLLLVATVESFAPLPTSQSPATCLYLKQNQGSQLVAAWNAAHAHAHDDDDDDDDEQDTHTPPQQVKPKSTTTPTISAARAFVSRVFKLPSTMIFRHPHPQQEGFNAEEKEDVVYYPIVGFRYIRTDDSSHSMAVPTSNCNASIRLLPQDEPVYGWYTAQACPLGNLDADDYCNEPVQEQNLTP